MNNGFEIIVLGRVLVHGALRTGDECVGERRAKRVAAQGLDDARHPQELLAPGAHERAHRNTDSQQLVSDEVERLVVDDAEIEVHAVARWQQQHRRPPEADELGRERHERLRSERLENHEPCLPAHGQVEELVGCEEKRPLDGEMQHVRGWPARRVPERPDRLRCHPCDRHGLRVVGPRKSLRDHLIEARSSGGAMPFRRQLEHAQRIRQQNVADPGANVAQAHDDVPSLELRAQPGLPVDSARALVS
jgi:hypothetical protein